MKKQEKKEHVNNVFRKIASQYDSSSTRISLELQKRWKALLCRRVVEAAGQGQKVLDVCCGTGDIAISVAGQRKDLSVTGLDLSPAMLEIARKKGGDSGNLTWIQADAAELPFPDNTFAAVSISFGLRGTADYRRVLQEMYRVTAPGGKVFCLDSFVPDNPVAVPVYEVYFRHLMPAPGSSRGYKEQYDRLHEPAKEFPGKKKIMRLLAQTGLKEVQSRSRMMGVCVLVEGRKP